MCLTNTQKQERHSIFYKYTYIWQTLLFDFLVIVYIYTASGICKIFKDPRSIEIDTPFVCFVEWRMRIFCVYLTHSKYLNIPLSVNINEVFPVEIFSGICIIGI